MRSDHNHACWRGKASVGAAKIRKVKADGVGPFALAQILKIGRASVYRALAERAALACSPRSVFPAP